MFLINSACEEGNVILETYNTPVLFSTKVLNYDSSELTLALNYALIKEKNGVIYENFPEKYHIVPNPPPNFIFDVDSIEYGSSIEGGNYSIGIMIGNNDELTTFDPHNIRFQAINNYIYNIEPKNEYLLSVYSRNGNITNDTLTLIGDGFNSQWNEEVSLELLETASQVGGTSSLYDALLQMINYVSNNASRPVKQIVVLCTGGDDGNSIATEQEVIDAATATQNNVKINFIWCSTEPFNLSRICYETGGVSIIGEHSVGQITTTFLSLDNILKRDMNYNQLTVKIYSDSNEFKPEFSMQHYLKIIFYQENYWLNFYFKI